MRLNHAICTVFSLFLIVSGCQKGVNKPKSEDPPPDISGAKYQPPDGECLFILGQSSNSYMEAYMEDIQISSPPAGFAYYTSLSDGAVQYDMPRYTSFLDTYPYTMLQLAIWTGEREWGDPGYYLDEIVAGRYDRNIEALADACNNLDRPIFVRFGYEFDGWHNAYPPDKYIAAYRYFVDMMRDRGVDNVAYVWHSWGVGAYYGYNDFPQYYPYRPGWQSVTQELWYPGDEYVDWLAISVFGTGWGNLSTNNVVQWFLTFADTHAKPVMIAEGAAIKTTGTSDPNWVIPNTQWFEQVIRFCNENDAVKAFTYINVDWEADNPSSTWGDTQVQNASSQVVLYWIAQIRSFLHANSDLYSLIDYE